MTAESGKYISPKDSIPKVKEFIEDLCLTEKQKEQINPFVFLKIVFYIKHRKVI